MTLQTYEVVKTKLWGDQEHGYIIVLECRDCGTAVDYPGHPSERTDTTCPGCGATYFVDG